MRHRAPSARSWLHSPRGPPLDQLLICDAVVINTRGANLSQIRDLLVGKLKVLLNALFDVATHTVVVALDVDVLLGSRICLVRLVGGTFLLSAKS